MGSFATSDKVKNANSLAFVDGVPIFERFFLGDEFTHSWLQRPLDQPARSARYLYYFAQCGGRCKSDRDALRVIAGVRRLPKCWCVYRRHAVRTWRSISSSFTPIGGDTQLFGNFEYRIPVIGNTVGLAAFADIGSAFNLRTKQDQLFNSNFLADQPFLSSLAYSLCQSSWWLCFGELVCRGGLQREHGSRVWWDSGGRIGLRDNRLITTQELDNARNLVDLIRQPGCLLVSSRCFSAAKHKPTQPFVCRRVSFQSLETIGLAWGWKCGCRCRSSTCLFD